MQLWFSVIDFFFFFGFEHIQYSNTFSFGKKKSFTIECVKRLGKRNKNIQRPMRKFIREKKLFLHKNRTKKTNIWFKKRFATVVFCDRFHKTGVINNRDRSSVRYWPVQTFLILISDGVFYGNTSENQNFRITLCFWV